LKLGLIDYSNSWPFLRHFRELDWPGLEIHADVPSGLNRLLSEGKLDVSAVSAYECLKAPEDYYILPDWSINSRRHVRSVMLFSRKPLDDLDHARIGLTSHSATSIHLLKLLLKGKGLSPEYLNDDAPNLDARLLIGDPALTYENSEYPHAIDLAKEWTQSTGCPMVFAVMAVRRSAKADLRTDLQRLSLELQQARKTFAKGLGPLKTEMEAQFPNISVDFDEYFSCLDFSFDSECQRGLDTYAKALATHGFIPPFSSLPISN